MSDVKRLLAEATPLPWYAWDAPRPGIEGNGDSTGDSIVVYGEYGEMEGVNTPENAALIVYAVNRLPDYEAAVEALERLADLAGPETNEPEWSGNWRVAWRYAREALARLRESVPA